MNPNEPRGAPRSSKEPQWCVIHQSPLDGNHACLPPRIGRLRVTKSDGAVHDTFAIGGQTLSVGYLGQRRPLKAQLEQLGAHLGAFTQPNPEPLDPDPPRPLELLVRSERLGLDLVDSGYADVVLLDVEVSAHRSARAVPIAEWRSICSPHIARAMPHTQGTMHNATCTCHMQHA